MRVSPSPWPGLSCTWGGLLSLLLLCIPYCNAETPGYSSVGCYVIDLIVPSVMYMGGVSETDEKFATPDECYDICNKLDTKYAAFQNATICFCLDELPETTGQCSLSCGDGSTCGGEEQLSVYERGAVASSYLELKEMVTDTYTISESVTVETNASDTVNLLWGDGGKSQDVASRTYPIQGDYTIRANLEVDPTLIASTQIHVRDAPSFTMECPSLLEVGNRTSCEVLTAVQGFAQTFSLNISSASQSLIQSGTIPDPDQSIYGHNIDFVSGTSYETLSDAVIFGSNGVVKSSGYITGVRLCSNCGNTLAIVAVTPKCSDGFEFCKGSCLSSCTATCSGGSYCPGRGTCSADACSESGASSIHYDYIELLADATYTAGMIVYLDPPVKVEEGMMLGYKSTTNMYYATVSEEFGDFAVTTLGIGGPKSSRVHGVQYIVQHHALVSLMPQFECTQSAPIAIADVETPYTAQTEDYINKGTFVIHLEVAGGAVGSTPVTHTSTPLCQIPVFNDNVTVEAEIWMAYGSLPTLPVQIVQGSPLLAHTVIDGKDIYHYHDDAESSTFTWAPGLNFAQEGIYTIEGTVKNAISDANFSSLIHVIPNITDTWTLEVLCPCYTIEEGFEYKLNFPEAAHPPWNATVTVAYTALLLDGTTSSGTFQDAIVEDFETFNNQGATSVTVVAKALERIYNQTVDKGGNYTFTVTLSNEVSETTVIKEALIEEALKDITGSIKWVLSGEEQEGSGADKDIFITNLTTLITPSAGSGVPLKWRVTLIDLPENIVFEENYEPDYRFNVTLDLEGEYSIIVEGYNTVQGWVSSDPINITFVNKIQNLELSDDGQLGTPNVSKIVTATFDILTPISCLVVSWGDDIILGDEAITDSYGDQNLCNQKSPNAVYNGMLSTPMNLDHEYSDEGVFEVVATAFDLTEVLEATLSVVVADVPCTMPEVSIVSDVKYVYDSPSYIMSMPINIEGLTKLQCNKTVEVKRYWEIYRADNETGDELFSIPVEGKLQSWNYSGLSIDPLFLPYGFYKLKYTVDVKASKVIALIRDASTYVEVIPSPLKAVIIEGSLSSIKRGFQQNIVMAAGTLSQDPDTPTLPMQKVTWYCRQILPEEDFFTKDADGFPIPTNSQPVPPVLSATGRTGGGCFGIGPGLIEMPGTDVIFEASSFYLATATLEFVIVVEKDERRAMASVQVEVAPLPPPFVSITCSDSDLCMPQSDGQLINPSIRLGLIGECLAYCTDPLYYHWEIKTIDDRNPIIDDPSCQQDAQDCPQSYGTTLITQSLVINPTLFRINGGVDRFTIRLTIITKDQRIGYSQITIRKNNPPSGGECSVDLDSGYCLITTFTLECKNWKDPEDMNLKSYNYYYLEYKEDGTISKSVLASTSASTSISELNAVLPLGDFEIRVEILDSFEATTDWYVGNVSTIMPTKEQVDDFNITEKMTEMSGSPLIGMYITAQNSINANANWTSLATSSLSGKSQEEVDLLLLIINENNAMAVNSLKATPPPTSITQVNAAAEVLSSAVKPILENPIASYTFDMSTREDFLQMLERSTGNLDKISASSPQQYLPLLRSAMNVVTAITEGINVILRNNDKAPPKDQMLAKDMLYDADVGDDIPQTLEEQHTKNILAMMKRQAKDQIGRMTKIIDQICDKIESKMVIGEVAHVISESGASALIAKAGEAVLQDEKLVLITSDETQRAALVVPKGFCPSLYFDEFSECFSAFNVRIIVWPLLTHAYSDSIDFISPKGCVVNVEIHSKDRLTSVKNLTNPMILTIPRQPGAIFPNETVVNVTSSLNAKVPLVYHHLNITKPYIAYIVQITPSDESDDLVMFIDYHRYPFPGSFNLIYFLDELPVENGTRTLFVSSDINKNNTGDIIIGIGKLNTNYDHEQNITLDDLDETFDNDYSFRVITTGCYFYENMDDLWVGETELKVIDANLTHTVCSTKHLTEFGSGGFFVPNEVNFELLHANLGFKDNSTLYIVLILIFVFYLLMMIWAHYKDRKDFERRGAIPFPDNKPIDKYIYEIDFHTGPDADAPCESNISFIASGDYAETTVRQMPKPTPNLYRRYDRNTFVMTTPGPLGPIHYMRIFHDNSGRPPYDSWQLDRVVIHDLQTHDYYLFETNSWLALDRNDGLNDRVFNCSNYNTDSTSFSQKMYNYSNRGANQDHMWMSMFLRPIGSRFSRKERVTTCTVFLYLSMIFSAMFYSVQGEQAREEGYFSVGPIVFSMTQIVIGIVILFFAYPIVVVLSMIFKRARPKNLKRCRAIDAIEKQMKEQFVANGMTSDNAEDLAKVNILPTDGKPKRKVELKSYCLPWWTRYLAWIISLVAIFASMFFVFAYGITWGEVTTTKWFASFFTTFAVSLVISQWAKVIIISCLSAIIDKDDLAVEDMDCDEELPNLKIDEKWSHLETMDSSIVRNVHLLKGVERRKNVRRLTEKLTKNRDMKQVVRGIMMYCLFLIVLIIIVSNRLDVNTFRMKRHFVKTFVKPGHQTLDLVNKIKTTEDFWHWAEHTVMNEIRAQRWYNDAPPYGLRGFLNDRVNRIIGYPILRQIRNGRFNCKIAHPMDTIIKECSGLRGQTTEDNRDYCAGWKSDYANPEFSGSCNYPEFKYQSADQLDTFPLVGRMATYGAGGYVVKLQGTKASILDRFNELQKRQWIDRRTRAVLLEFSVYNANVNLFATCTIFIEIMEGGGIQPKWTFSPVKLITVGSNFEDQIIFLCEIIFVIATTFFTLNELWKMKKQKCNYFSQYWNIGELLLLVSSYCAIFLYVYKLMLAIDNVKQFNVTKGNEYLRMDYAVLVDYFYVILLGLITFVSIIKLIKLLQFNKRMGVLADTIALCWEELYYFFIAFIVIFFAFSCLFYFMFMKQLNDFAYLGTAILTSFKMMLGKFEFQAMNEANALSPILFFVFSVMNSMVLINIMLSIILRAFNEVKKELQKKENQYNVIEFMYASLKKSLVQQPNAVNQVSTDTSLKKNGQAFSSEPDDGQDDKLPDKIGSLMSYINDAYFGGKMDMNGKKAMRNAISAERRAHKLQFMDKQRVYNGE